MKTTKKKLNEGFLADTANRVPAETAPAAAAQSAVADGKSGTDKKDSRDGKGNLPPIDTEARKKNRTLPTPKVLELLKTSNPGLFNLAEVVGKWVWVTSSRTIASALSFHLNPET